MNQHRTIRTLAYSLFLLWLLSLQACSCNWHMKKVKSKCGPLKQIDSVEISETTTEKVTQKDSIRKDTVYITVAGPTQYLPNPCAELCDSLGNVKPYYKEERKNGITSTVHTKGNVLIVDCKADSLEAIIEARDRTISYYKLSDKSKKHSSIKEVPVIVKTWWDKFLRWWFWISATTCAAIISIWIRSITRFGPSK